MKNRLSMTGKEILLRIVWRVVTTVVDGNTRMGTHSLRGHMK
jgi:hypothetical protein